ncbi:MAG: hypothetical protein RIS29_2588 [Bacteroidota bacterium]|jgi:uncharacterized membrane protein
MAEEAGILYFCINEITNANTQMKDKNYRSLAKSISYRISGTFATFLISLVVTGKFDFALSIMTVDFVSKIGVFYLHERIWDKVKFGRVPQAPEYEI